MQEARLKPFPAVVSAFFTSTSLPSTRVRRYTTINQKRKQSQIRVKIHCHLPSSYSYSTSPIDYFPKKRVRMKRQERRKFLYPIPPLLPFPSFPSFSFIPTPYSLNRSKPKPFTPIHKPTNTPSCMPPTEQAPKIHNHKVIETPSPTSMR